jgi:transcriptional regulator with XRE-family HTH domain
MMSDDTDMRDVSNALIKAREKAGLSQDELATRMGKSLNAVMRLESGRGNPRLDTLRRYAIAAGTKMQVTFE